MFCVLSPPIGIHKAGNSKPHPDTEGSGGWGEIGTRFHTCLLDRLTENYNECILYLRFRTSQVYNI